MKFLRLICLELDVKKEIEQFSAKSVNQIGKFKINNLGTVSKNGKYLSIWIFETNIVKEDYSVEDGYIKLRKTLLDECHKIITFFCSSFSVINQIALNITSPIPPYAFVPENKDENNFLLKCLGIFQNAETYWNNNFSFNLTDNSFQSLIDREKGVEILAEALRLNSNLAQFKEYMRLFELAFSHAGQGLYKPLLAFLNTSNIPFNKKEIYPWFHEIRSRAIHADIKGPIFEFEIVRSIAKMKLAAYDILFNKASWGNSDVTRRNEMETVSGPGFLLTARECDLSMSIFDCFGEYPLNLETLLRDLPEEWWFKMNSSNYSLELTAI